MTGGAAPLPSGLQEEGAAGSTQALYQRRTALCGALWCIAATCDGAPWLVVPGGRCCAPAQLSGCHSSCRERMKQMRGSRQPKKAWIMQKKERRRKQGRDVRPNSKYTGRRRPERF
ncbi:putative 18S rRNA (guanine-N(7))-methyltransferase [Portunus trituberculatus]|uniref:Putative 18S rRNA (Guanine-N(7))-methyltransferase n=1 Tax=Portunus trituberculatus TaxID=210409 RepID=A0A5B7IAZ4_PORTR|nr:putative 18S rRNA (guanine-N(7))-methyltransferase [Portunus trituberculatus]